MAGLDHDFDYIVAGAGSAGCVLAARLSEDRDLRILLLEAGPRDNFWFIKVPTALVKAIGTKAISWNYHSAEQHGLGDRRYVIPRGKVLGGSGSINGMVYFRGHPGDFDDWAALGNSGWGYADVLPYFIRSEANPTYPDSPYHGSDGPVRVANPPRPNRLVHDFLAATDSLQLPRNSDFNAADPTGFGLRQATIRDGVRESSATAFLREAEQRPNLTVVTGAMIDRVIVEDKVAVAIEVTIAGTKRRIAARREIVLCGGAYGSPAILQRSGIGDAAQLGELGIASQLHLPGVGQGLRDHPSSAVQVKTSDPTSYGLSLRSMPRNCMNLVEYLLRKSGPVGGSLFEATGFIKTQPELKRPDLQLVFMPAHRNAKPYPLPFGHGFGILSIAVRPQACGSVRIASADPNDPPLIDPNFLGDDADLATIRDGLLLARRILKAPTFARYCAHEILPGPATDSIDEWNDYIRRTAGTVHHPGCSARMGTDAMAVVDAELRVRGISGLRVADASVFPTIVAGNTNAAVVMIAEKAADMIRGRTPPPPLDLPHAD